MAFDGTASGGLLLNVWPTVSPENEAARTNDSTLCRCRKVYLRDSMVLVEQDGSHTHQHETGIEARAMNVATWKNLCCSIYLYDIMVVHALVISLRRCIV